MKSLYTLKGSKIQRYKNNVGKCIGGCVYVHRQYMEEVVPYAVWNSALGNIKNNSIFYTCTLSDAIVYNLEDKSIRFDSSPNFNTEREPCAGSFIKVFANGSIKKGFSNSIWHHKWLWVKDNYKGFDVAKSYAWSKKWLSKLEKPASGSRRIWEGQLKKVGLK